MKRLKQWEQEKSALEEGIKAVGRAKSVYERRLRDVADRLKLGSVGSPSVNSEAAEVMLNAIVIHTLSTS